MSVVTKTYRIWTGCGGWKRVTTPWSVWAATPRFHGALWPCVAIGAWVPNIVRLLPSPTWHWHPGVVHIPEPSTLIIMLVGLGFLALIRRKCT